MNFGKPLINLLPHVRNCILLKYHNSLVHCNIVVTTNFLFFRKLSLDVWMKLSNHGVKTKFRVNTRIFKQNVGLQHFLNLNIRGKQQAHFSDFLRLVNIALNQRSNLFWTARPELFVWYFDSQN